MFEFVKQIFISAMLIVKSLYIFFLVLKQINVVAGLTISMMHMQNRVFLILLKI